MSHITVYFKTRYGTIAHAKQEDAMEYDEKECQGLKFWLADDGVLTIRWMGGDGIVARDSYAKGVWVRFATRGVVQ